MQQKLKVLEERVCNLAADPGFIHQAWFVDHHLKIVEQLVNELCDRYPDADRNVCLAIVWLHDLGKILTSKKLSHDDEVAMTLSKGREMMSEIGFVDDFIDKVIADIDVFEQNWERDLSKESIEVRITSTADACSHFIGPFYAIYWHENPQTPINDHIAAGFKKIQKDWTRKIVLPEAKEAFQSYYDAMMDNDPKNRTKKFFGNKIV